MSDPWRIVNTSGPEALIEVYDFVGIDKLSVKVFTKTLQGISASRIRLLIYSEGGNALAGLALYSALRDHRAKVTAEISLAASAASVIAMAADKVLMQPTGAIMVHEAAMGLDGWATADELGSAARTTESISTMIAAIYQTRAGGTVASWREKMRAETWYDAAAAIKAGLADGMVGEENRIAASAGFQIKAGLGLYRRERDREDKRQLVALLGR
jgi:ATP-dependent protease ClpP protease subunit